MAGFTIEETAEGFILRRDEIEMRMTPEEFDSLKTTLDFWQDRRLSGYRVAGESAARPIVVHQVARAVVGADLIGHVLLNIVAPSGHYMTLAIPPPLATEIAQSLSDVLAKIENPTKQ